MRNNDAIRDAIVDLKQQRENIDRAIETLERLVPAAVAPESAAAKRGRKVKVAKVEASEKKGAKSYNLTCEKCKTKYLGQRKNAACPKCNPKIIDGKTWAQSQTGKAPMANPKA